MTAATLLAGALAGGADRLSPRDCWLCLAYLYGGGNTATAQLAAAISSGCDKLSDGDVEKCLAELLNSGAAPTTPVNLIPDGAVYDLSGDYVFIISDGVFNVPLVNGTSYVFTWGANETSIHIPAGSGYSPFGNIANPGSGSFTFVAGTQTPFFSIQLFGPVGQPITATIYTI
jgi:hypothetical protein